MNTTQFFNCQQTSVVSSFGGGGVFAVAQVGNLPYRRLAAGGVLVCRTACGLPIRDTADCQSALPSACHRPNPTACLHFFPPNEPFQKIQTKEKS